MHAPLWLALAALNLSPAFVDGPEPTIVGIEFHGNRVTRESVLLRELDLAPGDLADPERIEGGLQAIRDLGLFREVWAEQVEMANGVRLQVRMREKRYLLVLPRVDVDDELDYSYGVQLKRANLFGLNHSLDLLADTGRYDADRLRQREDRLRLTWDAPWLFGKYGLNTSLEHSDRLAPVDEGDYREKIHRAQMLVTRDFRDNRPRSGWVGGLGVFHRSQRASGPDAPPDDGTANALVGWARYDDVRFHNYSETGRSLDVRLELAHEGWLSDYGYRRIDVTHIDRLAVGQREHQNINFIGSVAWMGGGPRRRDAFDLGGATQLRGYESDYIQGQRMAYGAVEYLRPVFGHNWWRLLAVAEVGATGGSVEGARSGGPYASVGLGTRVRLPWFVNIELEIGVAQPLRGGDGPRLFIRGN
jgi:outer membrane protein assembly factor BamA